MINFFKKKLELKFKKMKKKNNFIVYIKNKTA